MDSGTSRAAARPRIRGHMAFRRASHSTRQKKTEQKLNSFDAASLKAEIDDWVSSSRTPIGELLIENGLDAEQLTNALWYQKEHGGRLGEILSHFDVVSEAQLADALATQFGIPRADLLHDKPDTEAIDRIDPELARKHQVIPFRIADDERVQVVVSDPLDTEAIQEITARLQRIALLVGTPTEI